MSENTGGLRRVLSSSLVYSALQRALGAERVRRALAHEYLRPSPGDRVLDLGCGPAPILAHLPEVHYVGVDRNARYISAARARYGAHGTFVTGDVREMALDAQQPFDLAIVVCALHHLDDEEAGGVLARLAGSLKPSGRLVTIDAAFEPDQSRAARWLIARDRGRHVRSATGYEALARPAFASVSTVIRDDLARVPYTYAILQARDPRPDRTSVTPA